MEAYARDCASSGFCINWRNEYCPAQTCPPDQFYDPCSTTAPKTCESIKEKTKKAPKKNMPTEGCYCPEGKVHSCTFIYSEYLFLFFSGTLEYHLCRSERLRSVRRGRTSSRRQLEEGQMHHLFLRGHVLEMPNGTLSWSFDCLRKRIQCH